MPDISEEALALKDYVPSAESCVEHMKKYYFNAMPEMCAERPRWITAYHKDRGLFQKDRISILDKACAYRYVLQRRKEVVRHVRGYRTVGQGRLRRNESFTIMDKSPFAGSTTSKFKGVPLYPELVGLIMWPELLTVATREQNPFQINRSEIDELNFRIFPFWLNRNILELTRANHYNDPVPLDDIQVLYQTVFYLTAKPVCISHTIPDFSRAVYEGLAAIIEDAAGRLAGTAHGSEEWLFYSALMEVLEGIIEYAERLAAEAERLAGNEPDQKERERLQEIASIYRRVPRNKAETLREGLTTVWLCWIALLLENPNVGLSLGRLDQLLYPLYEQDPRSTEEKAQEAVDLFCHLWLKIGDHVPTMNETGEKLFGGTGANQAITIGGVDKNGHDAVNDLTHVILRATELMELRDPNLNARYHPVANADSPGYLRRLCQVNLKTKATPAIHNDIPIIKALTGKGDSSEQANHYGIVGCVEPVSAGFTYGHNAAVLLNLTSAVELALYNGKHRRCGLEAGDLQIGPKTGNPETFPTFGVFKEKVKGQIHALLDRALRLNDHLGRIHQRYYPTPIMSALFKGPMDQGRDVVQGGAKINASGVALIGLADAADCLSAIEKHVYQDPTITFGELLQALKENFQGSHAQKQLHALLNNPAKTPKYGNDDPAADGNLKWLLQVVNERLEGRENYRGGGYRVGCWTMTIHAGVGRLTKALPNGRMDGDNFASGITPVSRMAPSLSSVLNSAARLPSEWLSSGVALNLRFTPDPEHEAAMLDLFEARIKAAFDDMNGARDGAIEVQFNITKQEDFLKAADPEYVADHPELRRLLVRVSGYTAYFVDLNKTMQEEIINRSEYQLSSGAMQKYALVDLDGSRQ